MKQFETYRNMRMCCCSMACLNEQSDIAGDVRLNTVTL